jgi:hypothetical protein
MADKNVPTSVLPEVQEWKRWGYLPVAVATALLAFQLQVAQAQEPPKWTQVAVNTTNPTIPVNAPTVSAKGGWQRTMDGRDFTSLSEKDVDGLTRAEKKAYYAWKNEQLDATISDINSLKTEKSATISTGRDALGKMDATISDINSLKTEKSATISDINSLKTEKSATIIAKNTEWINVLERVAKANGGKVWEDSEARIREALKDPHIPQNIKDRLAAFLKV